MAKLTEVPPLGVPLLDMRVAQPLPKVRDNFYDTAAWRGPNGLRSQALKRAGYRCEIPGCGRRAVVVDHKLRRRDGGRDTLDNLQCLCRQHDNLFKEGASGERRGGKSG